MALDRSERLTVAALAAFLATLAAVVALDDPIVWLGWSVAAVAVVGALLIAFNRSSPPD